MRILILFFLMFGMLLAQQDLGVQEDINSSYKSHLEEKKKVVIPEIVGLKPEEQKKLFDRSSKTYFEFPILAENKPSIVIKTFRNQEYKGFWSILACSDLGEKFNLKYAEIKKMKTIVRVIYKNGQSEVLSEDENEYTSEGTDSIPLIADNSMAFNGNPSQGPAFFKHFLIEIYIQDAFRKETGKLCVSEILPFDS